VTSETLASALHRVVAHHGDRVALVDAGRAGAPRVTFAELAAEADATTSVLAAQGLAPGDVLLSWLPNVREWLTTHLAAARLGVLVVPLNTRFRAAELASAMRTTGAVAIAVPTGFLSIDYVGILDEVLADGDAPAMRAILAVDCSERGDAPAPAVDGAIDLRAALAAVEDRAAVPEVGRAEDATIAFTTSGTTGSPKLALHTQAAVTAHAANVARALELEPGATLFAALPLYGVFGYSGAMAALMAGATVVLQPVFDGAAAARLFADTGVTHCYGPDPLLRAIVDGAQDDAQLATWRAGAFADFSGEGPEVAAMVEERLGVPMRGVYGSSECFALMSVWPPDAPPEVRLQGGGRPVGADIEVRAVDPESGRVLPAGEPGELQVRGYCVTVGYLGNPESTASSRSDDGWFRTGDLGHVGDDGDFVYLARIGDSLRLAGYLVDPQEIEEHVAGHPAVRRAAVVGVRQPGAGDAAVAFVQLHDGHAAAPDELRAFCRERIAAFKVPREIVVLPDLPTIEGPNGPKVQRARLREQARELLDDAR
jgi:acyl-CoA synthetase (AMP-forming)/AMP-acid ligase II